MMVSTLAPYGSVSDKEIKFITTFHDKFFAVDNSGNQWEISEADYSNLQNKGFVFKEVKRRK